MHSTPTMSCHHRPRDADIAPTSKVPEGAVMTILFALRPVRRPGLQKNGNMRPGPAKQNGVQAERSASDRGSGLMIRPNASLAPQPASSAGFPGLYSAYA